MSADVIKIQRVKLADMTDEEINVSKYRSLEARYNSVMEAVVKLEAQNDLFRNEVEQSRLRLACAQENVNINKKIVMDTILLSNSQKDSYLGEIADLKAKLNRG